MNQIQTKLWVGFSQATFGIITATLLVACEGNGAKSNATIIHAATTKPAIEAQAISTVWIKLKWKNLGVGIDYEVYRGTVANFEPTYNSLVGPPGLAEPSFDDDRLDPGTTYYYKVYGRSFGSTGPAIHIGDISATTPTNDN